MMRNIKLAGFGRAVPEHTVKFGSHVRHRLSPGESFLDLMDVAISRALENAGVTIDGIDCIVCGTATPLQPLPCNAALIHERVAKHRDIPALDINTSCTSFISALDVMSYLIAAGRYERVLIVSGDMASCGLNEKERESYELFSDAATAFIVTPSKGEAGILYSAQKTWSEGVHDTEIAGGGGLLPAWQLTDENRAAYLFHMEGIRVLKLSMKVLPGFLSTCFEEAGIEPEKISRVIPHQASRVLKTMMSRLGFSEDVYENHVEEYGNMVSASIPYTLCEAIKGGRVRRGDTILLMGTAAGLTINFMLLRY